MKRIVTVSLFHCSLLIVFLFIVVFPVFAQTAPYPPSDHVTGITFDQSTITRSASGSDLFSTTWSGDDNIYTAYADGSGFSGGEADSYLGVARITAELNELPTYTASDVWSTNGRSGDLGKCNGCILAIGNTLYMYAQIQDQGWGKSTLLTSHDNGSTWLELDGSVYDRSISNWLFTETGVDFSSPGIIQFGKGYELNAQIADPNINGYVFGYSSSSCSDTSGTPGLCLFRVPQSELDTISSYEFFSGTSLNPAWSSNPSDKKPVFILPNLNWGYNAMYHPVFQRYWISARHDANTGGYGSGVWGLYDAPTPWGPWTTIAYDTDFPFWTYALGDTSGNTTRPAFTHTFPAKWISPDGTSMWVTSDRGDQFNLYRSTVTFNGSPILTPTSGPTNTPVHGSIITGLTENSSDTYLSQTNLQVGSTSYVDRAFTYSSIPPNILGANYIQTANDDKSIIDDQFLTFTLTQDATVYIARDNRISTKPSWLTTSFTDTGDDLVSGGGTFSLYSANFTTGTVTLGGNEGEGNSMYTVIVVPISQPSKPGDTDNDGDVDISDLSTLLATFGSTGSGLSADFDGDGDVDISDLSTLLANFGS